MTRKGEIARDAIEELFGDTSVEKQVTLDDLEELQSDIESKVETLREDIENE